MPDSRLKGPENGHYYNPDELDFGGIGGSGLSEDDQKLISSALRGEDPRAVKDWLALDDNVQERGERREDGLWNYSDNFVPFENIDTIDREDAFHLGQERLDRIRQSITIEELSKFEDEFVVLYKGEMGKKKFRVCDIKNLPDNVFDYCIEEFYWGMQRKEVHQHLAEASASWTREQQKQWLQSILDDTNSHMYFVFDTTNQNPKLIGHANMKSKPIDGREGNMASMGQAIYFQNYRGSNREKTEGNNSIGYRMIQFRIKKAIELGIGNMLADVEVGNLSSEALMKKEYFINSKRYTFVKSIETFTRNGSDGIPKEMVTYTLKSD